MADMGFTIYDVLALGGARHIGRPSPKGEWKVQCPCGVQNAKGKPATFDVNLTKENFKCYHECAGCVGHGGMLDLYNLLCQKQTDRKAAYREIMDRLGRGESPVCNPYENRRFVPQKIQSNTADAGMLDRVYRAFLSALTLNGRHYADLQKRGLTAQAIQNGLYRSVPQSRKEWDDVFYTLQKQEIDLRGVPGFYREDGRYAAAVFGSGFFIPYFNEYRQIAGMQIRFDTAKSKSGRYLWFSSAGYECGCSARNIPSYGAPGVMPEAGCGSLVFVTEG